jgi:hypothetical protein
MIIIPIYFVTIGLNEFIFIFQSVFTPEGNQPEDTPATSDNGDAPSTSQEENRGQHTK